MGLIGVISPIVDAENLGRSRWPFGSPIEWRKAPPGPFSQVFVPSERRMSDGLKLPLAIKSSGSRAVEQSSRTRAVWHRSKKVFE